MKALAFLAGGAAAADAYCSKTGHTIQNLPYADDSVHPCQYAGTFPVGYDDTVDHNLFYWFFRHSNESKPLLIWLNGGPGATSMFGLFLENGPLRAFQDGDDFTISAAANSWADDYHIIFLDQPVQTGFSFGDSAVSSMDDGATEFTNFLDSFFAMYPELKSNDFYLTGESYAGKYLPLFTHRILENNNEGRSDINLKGTLIIDPYPSPEIQRTNMHIVPQALGMVDQNNLEQIDALEQRCFYDHAHDISKAKDSCNDVMHYISKVSGGVLNFNSRLFDYDWDSIESPYINLLGNSPRKAELYQALHVENSTKEPIYQDSSDDVTKAYAHDNLVDYSYYYNYLIEREYPLIVQAGEYDMQDGAASQMLWMSQLLNLTSTFWEADRAIYKYEGLDGGMKVGGYFKKEGAFTLITVPKSGHFFPYDNYEDSKAILDDFVSYQQLECHADECRVNEFMCEAMNNCSGHGSCQGNGQCLCQEGFIGADCSHETIHCDECSYPTNGTNWLYYEVKDFATWDLSISLEGEGSFDLFISKYSEKTPSQFNFDAALVNLQSTKISQETIGSSYALVAVKVNGFDNGKNLALAQRVNFSLDSHKPGLLSFLSF